MLSSDNTLKTLRVRSTLTLLLAAVFLMLAAEFTAWRVQTDGGQVLVSNVTYPNYNGIPIRAKLFQHTAITTENPGPGAVYTHGYQNNRETSDANCIEMARRGFVMLCIDAIGRGNSGNPNDVLDPTFDPSYGVETSLQYLRDLPFVDATRTGLMGHSLGAEMSYGVALNDPAVQAIVVSGYAYTDEATTNNPKNMLMIFGQYDEYRARMTGTQDFAAEWMDQPVTLQVIPDADPQFAQTYGDFEDGSARRVFMPSVIHIQESHNHAAIAEATAWMKAALEPDEALWIDPAQQTWALKEYATLIAMLACLATILPLSALLIELPFFQLLRGSPSPKVAANGKQYLKHATINGLLSWLYLPLILTLFAVHLYVVPIDKVFPMMLVNGIVWWFLIINVIGFFIWRAWYRKQAEAGTINLVDAGVSEKADRLTLSRPLIVRTVLFGLVLFLFAYLLAHLFEAIFIVDLRFIFPFASDLTPYRALMMLLYFPFLFLGFLQMGNFLYSQVRRPARSSFWGTFASWSGWGILAVVTPLLLFLAVQYIPIFTIGVVPFVGPGGVLANFTMSLFHIIGVLVMVIPVSTWLFQLTGKIYAGALVSALLVAWMFASAQVIAPIPV
jgi:uncharacterized protein